MRTNRLILISGALLAIVIGGYFFVEDAHAQKGSDHWSKKGLYPTWANRFFAPSTNSQVRISFRHNDTQVVGGQFGRFSNNIFYFDDSGDLLVKFNIMANSLTTGNEVMDSIMMSKDWLDVENAQQISFSSTSGRKSGNGGYEVKGDLTIKGKTESVTLRLAPFKLKKSKNHMNFFAFEGEIKVKRSAFDITGQRDWYPSPWKVNIGDLSADSEMVLSVYFIAQSWGQKWGSDVFHMSPDNPVGKLYDIVSTEGYKKGIKAYEKMKKDNPDQLDENTLGYVAFILTLGKQPSNEEFESAFQLFEYNIKQYPDYAISQKNYAETLAMAKKIDEAQSWFDKVKAKDESLLEGEFFNFYGIN